MIRQTFRAHCKAGIGTGVILLMAGAALAGPSADVKTYLEELEGSAYRLRIDVVHVRHLLGGIDATHMKPDGTAYYRGRIGRGWAVTETTDSAAFVRAVSESVATNGFVMDPRIWRRGSEVAILGTSARGDEVRIDIHKPGGAKSRIRFKYDNGYTLDDVRAVFAASFAESGVMLPGVGVAAQRPPLPPAQAPVRLAVGTKVRVTTPFSDPRLAAAARDDDGWIVGKLVASDVGSITVRPARGDGELVIPRDAILDFEVKNRTFGLKESAVVIGGTAALNAALAMVLTGTCTGEEPPESDCNDSAGESARKGAVWGAAWGTGLAIVGLAIGVTWEASPLPGLSVAVEPQRSGIGMSLAVSF